MQEKIAGVMDSLYPATRAYRQELEALAAIEGATGMDSGAQADAIIKQRQRLADAREAMSAENFPALERPQSNRSDEIEMVPGLPMPIPALDRMEQLGASLSETFGRLGGKTGQAMADITDALLHGVTPALVKTEGQAMTLAERMSLIGGALGSIVGSIFGKKAGAIVSGIGSIATAFGGFRANGGPVSSGKAYMVGEKGPEMFIPGIAGMILPNINMRMPSLSSSYDRAGSYHNPAQQNRATHIRVEVVEGALFRPVVTQISEARIGMAAPNIVGGAPAAGHKRQ